MAHDVTRSAFDPHAPKHWTGVRAQQGRLLSDDDWNEAEAIGSDDIRRTRAQVIGPAGSPDAGFRVTAPRAPNGRIDFDLQPGTMYVGGHRVTLERPESFALQRDWLQQPAAERPDLAAERIDAVYLEVWEQPVTAVEDAELTEIALGGPDTSVRMRLMRRVRVLPGVGTENCATAWTAVRAALGTLSDDHELLSTGLLTVGFEPNAGSGGNLCSPSAQDGYLGAENQAIRVEIGGNGDRLLWSYDNASPLYRVRVNNVAGVQRIRFLQPPKDEAHWPLAQQTVELLPWSAVLPNGQKVAGTHGGHLARVTASYDPADQSVAVTPAVPSTFGATWQSRSDAADLSTVADSYFYLRVWNRGTDTASSGEIAFTPGTPLPLAGTGLTVTLTGGPLRPGDFWIIAARPESPARVVPWRLESGMPAEGPRRFYAPLGIVHWRPGGTHTVFDCRPTVEPLTRSRGCCVTVSPSTNWQHTLDSLAGMADVCVCFQPGDYTTDRTIEFRNRTVRLHGDGAGSRIFGRQLKAVFRFVGCESVDVSDLTVRGDVTGPRPGSEVAVDGAITALDCTRVAVSRVVAGCAPDPVTCSAAVSLHTRSVDQSSALRTTARITDCDITVGANQIGLQVVNYGRSVITGNTVRADPANAKFPVEWLKDIRFLRQMRTALLYGHSLTEKPGFKEIRIGDVRVWLRSDLTNDAWQTVAKWRKLPPRRRDYLAIGDFLDNLAESLLRGIGTVGVHTSPEFRTFIQQQLLSAATTSTGIRMPGARGIVVGGAVARDVRISGNTVGDVVRGISVGISTQGVRKPAGLEGTPRNSAGRVVVTDNIVNILLAPESVTGGRHGIFVGNHASLSIDGNMVGVERIRTASRLAVEGIRVYGFYGRSALISRNHLIFFDSGVRAAALNNIEAGSSSLWRVSDNIAVKAKTCVDTSLKKGSATHVDVVGNKP
ncbi:DUF6519 domain-containing protein [Actinoplanes sp. CA-252034]|uniref:DUF6519 domain-containing protein n=1 Tax=Actinoplanes sp. CA-252034 TaxID=3239906 RepID=UPI003D97303D